MGVGGGPEKSRNVGPLEIGGWLTIYNHAASQNVLPYRINGRSRSNRMGVVKVSKTYGSGWAQPLGWGIPDP